MKDKAVVKKTNWQAVFVAYCNGAPSDELAQIFDVEIAQVTDRIHRERWAALRANLPLGETLKSDSEMRGVSEIRLAAIQANREKNLAAWSLLRGHVISVIEKLAAGTLKMEKVFNGKTGITRVEDLDPTTGDLVNIATALRTATDGTYRAIGDFQAQDKPGQDGSVNGQPPPPSITIILPSVISQPRDSSPTQIIDLRPDAVQQLKSAKAPEPGGAAAGKTVETNPTGDRLMDGVRALTQPPAI